MALYLVSPRDNAFHEADPSQPMLHADDLAALRGDGVFELALVRGDEIRALDLHLDRFAQSARALSIDPGEEQLWIDAITAAAAHVGGERDGYVRWQVERGRESGGDPIGWVTSGHLSDAQLDERARGIRAVTLSAGHPAAINHEAPWLLIGVKSLSYAARLAATRFAKARGADDAIFVSTDGFVLEAPRANVVIARGNELLTPDPNLGLLHGTTQRFIFERATAAGWTCRYARLRLEDLFSADGVWLTSSTRMAVRVHSLNSLNLDGDGLAEVMAELVS